MRVAWIGRLDYQRLRLRLHQDRCDLAEIDIVVVRTFVIAPADMDAAHFGRDIAQRVVQHLDMKRGALEEVGLAQLLEAGVVRHRQIGAIELQHKAGTDDRLVLLLHRRGDCFDIGLVRGVVGLVWNTGTSPGEPRS